MADVCRTSTSALNQAESGRSKRNWSASEESQIRSKTKAEHRRLELAKKVGGNDNEARILTELQRAERVLDEYESVSIDLIHLYPNEFNKQENYLAKVLGIHKRVFGIGDDLTQAGAVKLQIADIKQSSANLIDTLGRYAFKRTANDSLHDIHDLLKSRGISRGKATDEFLDNVAQVAKSPRQRVSYGNTDTVNMVLNKRHNKMMEEATKLGLSTDDLDLIVAQLSKVMKPIDDVHALAKVLGAQIGNVDNIGYTMRELTEKAQAHFKLRDVDVSSWGKRSIGTSSVQRSRESWALIPEDYEVLASFLTPGKNKDWNDVVKSMFTDIKATTANELLAQEKLLRGSVKSLDKARRAQSTAERILTRYSATKAPDSARLASLTDRVTALTQVGDDIEASHLAGVTNSSWVGIADLYSNRAGKFNMDTMKGRKAFLEDITKDGAIDYNGLLRKYGGDEDKALDVLSSVTGKTPDELHSMRFSGLDTMVTDIHGMADDGMELTSYLHKNLSGQQLDELVDAGILHKLEMTTRELADYTARQYNLPYQKALDNFEFDFPKRMDMYVEKLRVSASESNLIKRISTDGVDAGWAVPNSMLDPIEHKGFVALGDIDLKRFGLDPKVAEQWQGISVHPTVKAQLSAYLELSTNPGKLGQFANIWSYVLSNFNLATLTANGVPFLNRNVIAGVRNYVAGGGNLARVIPGIHEYASVVGKGGLEALDDTRKIVKWPGTGETLTKREAFKRMFVKRGTDYVSAESGNVIGVGSGNTPAKRIANYAADVLPPIALPRAIRQQYEYAKEMGMDGWGLKEAAGLGAKQLSQYIRTTFAPIAYGNAVVDGGLKWSWMMTHLDSVDGTLGKMDDFGKFVTGGVKYKDAGELFDNMDNFFINGYTTGTLQKTLSKYVVPFGTFAMTSTPMAIRHMTRNPAQFMAYLRMMRMNHRENMNDPHIREAGYSDYEMAALPMTLFKDYKNPSQVLTLFPTNVDMYQSSIAYLAKQTQRIGRLGATEGGFVGQGTKDRAQVRDPYNLMDFVKDNIKDNQNPVFAAVTELMSGKDSLGRDIDKNERAELGGMKIDPKVAWILSKIPGVSQFNGAFGGRGAITGNDGTIQAPPVPGVFGTPMREDSRTEEGRYRAGKFMGNETYDVIRKFVGLDVRTIDTAEGRQTTMKDIRFTIATLQKREKALAVEVQSPDVLARRQLVAQQMLVLKVDEARVSKYMKDNNVTDPKALQKLNVDGITVRSLPIPNATVTKYIDEYIKTMQVR